MLRWSYFKKDFEKKLPLIYREQGDATRLAMEKIHYNESRQLVTSKKWN
jgi:hypothetical protein